MWIFVLHKMTFPALCSLNKHTFQTFCQRTRNTQNKQTFCGNALYIGVGLSDVNMDDFEHRESWMSVDHFIHKQYEEGRVRTNMMALAKKGLRTCIFVGRVWTNTMGLGRGNCL